jgi:hypothetical protein
VAAANVLEVYAVRAELVPEDAVGGASSSGAVFDGVSGARLELVCHYRCGPRGLIPLCIYLPFWSSGLGACVSFSRVNSLSGVQAPWQHRVDGHPVRRRGKQARLHCACFQRCENNLFGVR